MPGPIEELRLRKAIRTLVLVSTIGAAVGVTTSTPAEASCAPGTGARAYIGVTPGYPSCGGGASLNDVGLQPYRNLLGPPLTYQCTAPVYAGPFYTYACAQV
ncbi:MAG TPA: hypothetical protein VM097_02050 [Mycobacteriales bacterium]|nr:hypothetical protein [Mycobacteriales bacterium]